MTKKKKERKCDDLIDALLEELSIGGNVAERMISCKPSLPSASMEPIGAVIAKKPITSARVPDPPALAFANTIAGSHAPAISYAVYPLTMLLRITVAQVLVILLGG